MKISIRRDRFLKLSEKRLNKALAAIDSIENLSNKSNYDYEVDEINDMAGRLMARVKFVMSSFGSATAQDRFNRLIEQDVLQYQLLEREDPDVYKFIHEAFEKDTLKKSYVTKMQELNKSSEAKMEDELLNKFRSLYDELEQKLLHNKKSYSVSSKPMIPRTLSYLKNVDNDFFILDPEYEIRSLKATHNINRLLWLKNGRTFKEIMDPGSPYNKHPDPKKTDPERNLKWDIDQGRVIQATSNSIII